MNLESSKLAKIFEKKNLDIKEKAYTVERQNNVAQPKTPLSFAELKNEIEIQIIDDKKYIPGEYIAITIESSESSISPQHVILFFYTHYGEMFLPKILKLFL